MADSKPLILFSRYETALPDLRGWGWVYFHGQCEDYVAQVIRDRLESPPPDLIACLGVERDEVPDGVHDVQVYNEPAKLFIWTYTFTAEYLTKEVTAKKWEWSNPEAPLYVKEAPGRHGLVVFEKDLKSLAYAKQVMEEKRNHL